VRISPRALRARKSRAYDLQIGIRDRTRKQTARTRMAEEANSFDGKSRSSPAGASGIGARLCMRLAQPGCAFVVHTGTNLANAERVVAQIKDKGASAHVVVEDFSGRCGPAGLSRKQSRAFGRASTVSCNLAAYADRTKFGALTEGSSSSRSRRR